jgi:hypothetical protein
MINMRSTTCARDSYLALRRLSITAKILFHTELTCSRDLPHSELHLKPIQRFNTALQPSRRYVWRVTTHASWIDDRIYWTLWYSTWLHFTIHCYTYTLVSTVTSSLPLLGSGFNGRRFPSSGFPASVTSFSQQQHTRTEHQRLSN